MQDNKQGVLTTELPERNGNHLSDSNSNALVKISETNGNSKIALSQKSKVTIPRADAKAFAALEAAENASANTYQGLRGWFRLMLVASVVCRLALYLYLDRYDISYKYYRIHVENRFERARQMNWLAVLGEYLLEIYRFFFDKLVRLTRWYVLRGEKNKERLQEKQAIWLKKSIIKLGPTFIKIGQALGTRADLLPLPYVKELGTLQDDVPAFSNEIAFARIEKELGKQIGRASCRE